MRPVPPEAPCAPCQQALELIPGWWTVCSCRGIPLFLTALSEEPVCCALGRGVRLETAFLSADSALASAGRLAGTRQVQLVLIIWSSYAP